MPLRLCTFRLIGLLAAAFCFVQVCDSKAENMPGEWGRQRASSANSPVPCSSLAQPGGQY